MKYGRHNYRAAGVRASVYFDAAVGRHLFSWWEGQDIDPESGMHHIDKAIAGLMVLRDSQLQGNWVDDRPPAGDVDLDPMNARAGALIDMHADKRPKHYTIADDVMAGLGPYTILVPYGLSAEDLRKFIAEHAAAIKDDAPGF